MSVRLGNGNWAVSSSKLLAYNDAAGPFFNKEFDFTRATTATRYNKSSLIESVDNNIARIDFLGSSEGHLLLEPASTNKITESENVNGGGNSPNRIDRTLNVAVAPDGTTTADLCIPNTETGHRPIYQYRDNDTSTSFVSGSNYAFSVFAKPNTTNGAQFVQMSTFIDTGGNNIVNFDIVNGTITQTGFVSSKIENYGNGWFRCSVVFGAKTGSSAGGTQGWGMNLITAGDSSRGESFTGDGSSNGVLVWGAQFEEQIDFATSYIPTDGSAVTRNAEVCEGSGAAQDFNSLGGVLYAEMAGLDDDLTNREIQITDGSSNNRVTIFFGGASNRIRGEIKVGGSTAFNSLTTSFNIENFNKIALRYGAENFAFYINGTLISRSDTQTSIFSANELDSLNFLRKTVGSTNFYGKVREVRAYTRLLTDAELITLTT